MSGSLRQGNPFVVVYFLYALDITLYRYDDAMDATGVAGDRRGLV